MGIETSTTTTISQATVQEGVKAQGSDKLGKNEFLKILTEQLANQDPTKPMDSNAFVAQLAQFSTLEQMQNTNDTLTQMLGLQQSSSQNAAVAMVGKDALYDGHQMGLTEGGKITVNATLGAASTDVIMEIDDADGNIVRRQSFGAMSAGTHDLTWDGLNNNGVVQLPGTYYVTVTGADLSGNPVSISQQSRGHISGVSFEDGSIQLTIGNTSISLSDVKSIQESKTTP
jgi:flagellar basal-body rod modification protein FlgD